MPTYFLGPGMNPNDYPDLAALDISDGWTDAVVAAYYQPPPAAAPIVATGSAPLPAVDKARTAIPGDLTTRSPGTAAPAQTTPPAESAGGFIKIVGAAIGLLLLFS